MASQTTIPPDAVWFITGCSSGIGRALVSHLSKTPARVVATARNLSALTYASGPNILKLALDVTSTSAISASIAATLEQFGRIDVLVNNAGYGLMGDTEALTNEAARAAMDTNFFGAVDLTKEALRVMREVNGRVGERGGLIMQVSSMGGRNGYAGQPIYHASKFALEGFTESVSKEIPADWNIKFCIIEPGGVETEYAGGSMKFLPRHPAYMDPNLPTNQMRAMLGNPANLANFAPPEKIAEVIVDVVHNGISGANEGKGGIPLRLPLGADAWGMLKHEAEKNLKDLEALKEVSCSTSNAAALAQIDWLK